MKPMFSVLMAAYNSEATIAESLDSLLAQSRDDWEAIVVDDGSTDGTAEVARLYAERDARFTVLTKPNGGAASARNMAAARASADLWALLDADDQYLPDYFERMHRFVEAHPWYGIYSSDGYVFSAGEEPRPDDLQPDGAVRSYSAEDLLVRNRIRVLTMFRRDVFELVGGFDEDRGMLIEDWNFWLQALLRGATHIHNPERLWKYRVSAGQKTSDPLKMARGDAYLFERLLADGGLDAPRSRLARSTLRATRRHIRRLEAGGRRRGLEHRLAGGDFAGARAEYAASWRGYSSKPKYLAGLVAMIVSPRLFARISLRDRAGTDSTGGESAGRG